MPKKAFITSSIDEKIAFGILFLVLIGIGLSFIPVKTLNATVVNKDWTTYMQLRERYNTTEVSCSIVDGKSRCTSKQVTKTRILDTKTFSGGATDPILYPPEYQTSGRQYNHPGGSFVITYLDEQEEIIRTRNVSQKQFENNYVLGLTCEIKLNVYKFVIKDNCVAKGR